MKDLLADTQFRWRCIGRSCVGGGYLLVALEASAPPPKVRGLAMAAGPIRRSRSLCALGLQLCGGTWGCEWEVGVWLVLRPNVVFGVAVRLDIEVAIGPQRKRCAVTGSTVLPLCFPIFLRALNCCCAAQTASNMDLHDVPGVP